MITGAARMHITVADPHIANLRGTALCATEP
jgi:hypothetical protein